MEADISPKRKYAEERRKEIKDGDHYYDSHTVYIENNGNSESRIRSILDEIVYSHPLYQGKTINAASKYILNYGSDNSICMFHETSIYDFIFALDEEGNEIDILSGANMKYSDLQLLNDLKRKYEEHSVKDWSYSDIGDKELLAIFHPCKVKGQTPISRQQRDDWKLYLRSEDDIALIQTFVKPIWDAYEKGTIIIKNLPNWEEDILKELLRDICRNALTIEVNKNTAVVIFDEKYMEASFKYCILNNLRILVEIKDYTPIYRRLDVKYRKSEQTVKKGRIDTGGSPKNKMYYSTVNR